MLNFRSLFRFPLITCLITGNSLTNLVYAQQQEKLSVVKHELIFEKAFNEPGKDVTEKLTLTFDKEGIGNGPVTKWATVRKNSGNGETSSLLVLSATLKNGMLDGPFLTFSHEGKKMTEEMYSADVKSLRI